MVGLHEAKAACAVAVAILALINALAVSHPRFRPVGTTITYPWLNSSDTYRVLSLPVLSGPSVNTILPVGLFVSSDRLFVGPLTTDVSSASLWPKSTSTKLTPLLRRLSPDARVSCYGISSRHLDVAVSETLSVLVGKRCVVVVGRDYLMVVSCERASVRRCLGGAYVSASKASLVMSFPERILEGAYTWRPRLPLSLPFPHLSL